MQIQLGHVRHNERKQVKAPKIPRFWEARRDAIRAEKAKNGTRSAKDIARSQKDWTKRAHDAGGME